MSAGMEKGMGWVFADVDVDDAGWVFTDVDGANEGSAGAGVVGALGG